MIKAVANDQAFPMLAQGIPGMTLRHYFAGQAMAGLMAKYAFTPSLGLENFKVIAEAAVGQADALIEALNDDRRS